MPPRNLYLGKFRGSVANSKDPAGLGRIKVKVPDVLGRSQSNWALPCFPVSGMFLIPAVGANVWVEFEKGDPSLPIWTGVYYSDPATVPEMARDLVAGSPAIICQGSSTGLKIDTGLDGRSRARIGRGNAAGLVVCEGQLEIGNGQGARISLSGPQVDINGGALTVV